MKWFNRNKEEDNNEDGSFLSFYKTWNKLYSLTIGLYLALIISNIIHIEESVLEALENAATLSLGALLGPTREKMEIKGEKKSDK